MVRPAAKHGAHGAGAVPGPGPAGPAVGRDQAAACRCYFEPMKKNPLFLALLRPSVAKDLAAAS